MQVLLSIMERGDQSRHTGATTIIDRVGLQFILELLPGWGKTAHGLLKVFALRLALRHKKPEEVLQLLSELSEELEIDLPEDWLAEAD